MKIYLQFINHVTVLFIGCGLILTIIASDKTTEIERVFNNVSAENARQFKLIDEMISQANQLARDKQYAGAMEIYKKVQELLNQQEGQFARFKRERFARTFQSFRNTWVQAVMTEARNTANQGQYEQAINIASEVNLIDPQQTALVADFVEYCRKLRRAAEFRDKTTLNEADNNYKNRREQIDLLFREAQILYKNQRYNEVRNKLEHIFLVDPYNQSAIDLLNATYEKLYKYALERRKADIEEMLAYNQWQWNEPVLPIHMQRSIESGAEIKRDSAGLYQRLEQIIFPGIEFEDADIFAVIRQLNRLSKRYDPDKAGVTIVSGFDKTTAEQLPKVTMSFSKIPMGEVLRYLCQATGLKYKVDESAIIIGVNVDTMRTAYFPVRGDLIAGITGIADAGAEGGEGNDRIAEMRTEMATKDGEFANLEDTFDPDKTTAAPKKNLTSEALIRYFDDRGVKFDPGATIAYNRRRGVLEVTNTSENLRRLDDLLRQLDIKIPLVMIEAKIVEISQIDLEELGFDWYFNASGNSWDINRNGPNQAQVSPLRHWTSIVEPNTPGGTSPSGSYKVINDLKIFPNFGESLFGADADVNLSLTVNAISQNERTETLSAPKIISTSGSPATIRMVEQTYFPTDWDEPEMEVSGDTVQITPPKPNFDEATDLGILFTVRPVVSPDNYTISLHLQPQVVSFLGWSYYPINIQTGYISSDGTQTAGQSIQTEIKMPQMARRDIDVHLKVYDGETIVLGGMVENTAMSRGDKWPGLGELPLIGRLFQSQMAYSSQKNLLIFVTTRLINNDGIPVRRHKNQAIPEFYR